MNGSVGYPMHGSLERTMNGYSAGAMNERAQPPMLRVLKAPAEG